MNLKNPDHTYQQTGKIVKSYHRMTLDTEIQPIFSEIQNSCDWSSDREFTQLVCPHTISRFSQSVGLRQDEMISRFFQSVDPIISAICHQTSTVYKPRQPKMPPRQVKMPQNSLSWHAPKILDIFLILFVSFLVQLKIAFLNVPFSKLTSVKFVSVKLLPVKYPFLKLAPVRISLP